MLSRNTRAISKYFICDHGHGCRRFLLCGEVTSNRIIVSLPVNENSSILHFLIACPLVTFCKTVRHCLGTSMQDVLPVPQCLQGRACQAKAPGLLLAASSDLTKPVPSQSSCLGSPKGLQMACFCPEGQTDGSQSGLSCSQGNVVAGSDPRTIC